MHLPAGVRQYGSSSEMNVLHRLLSAVCGWRSMSIQGKWKPIELLNNSSGSSREA